MGIDLDPAASPEGVAGSSVLREPAVPASAGTRARAGSSFLRVRLPVAVWGLAHHCCPRRAPVRAHGHARGTRGIPPRRVAPRVIGPWIGGSLADRLSPRRVMIVAGLVQGLLTASLVVADRAHSVWALYAAVALAQFVGSLARPSQGALLPTLVSADRLSQANALYGTFFSSSIFVAPAIGAVLLVHTGPGRALPHRRGDVRGRRDADDDRSVRRVVLPRPPHPEVRPAQSIHLGIGCPGPGHPPGGCIELRHGCDRDGCPGPPRRGCPREVRQRRCGRNHVFRRGRGWNRWWPSRAEMEDRPGAHRRGHLHGERHRVTAFAAFADVTERFAGLALLAAASVASSGFDVWGITEIQRRAPPRYAGRFNAIPWAAAYAGCLLAQCGLGYQLVSIGISRSSSHAWRWSSSSVRLASPVHDDPAAKPIEPEPAPCLSRRSLRRSAARRSG